MSGVLSAWCRILLSTLVGVTGVTCSTRNTSTTVTPNGPHSTAVQLETVTGVIRITSDHCDRTVMINRYEPLHISFTSADIPVGNKCRLHINTMYSRKDKICINVQNDLNYVDCHFMIGSIDSEPFSYYPSYSSTVLHLCMYDNYCFDKTSQITIEFQRTYYHDDDDDKIVLDLKATSHKAIRTTTRSYNDWGSNSYDHDYDYDNTGDYNDSLGVLEEQWFYFVFVGVLGLCVCLVKVCRGSSRNTSNGRHDIDHIEAPYPDIETSHRLVIDMPVDSPPPTYQEPSAPPDYNTLYAQYQTGATPGLLSNMDRADGRESDEINDGAKQNIIHIVNDRENTTDGQLTASNYSHTISETRTITPDPPADEPGNADMTSSLPPPPSYEDAIRYTGDQQ